MDEWMDSLRRVDGALRPDGGATGRVQQEVRRRRRRRSAATAVAAAASVAVVLAGVAVAVQGGDEAPDRVVGDPSREATSAGPTPADPAATSPAVDPRTFECPTESKVFDPDARAPDAPSHRHHEWRRIYADVAARDEWPGFTVRRLEGSLLGVIALVEGDVQGARRLLMDEYGVTSVVLWDPVAAAAGDHDEWTWMTRDFQQRLSAVADQVPRLTQGVPGHARTALWVMEAAVLVQWKRPVPPQVRALEDVQFKTGGRVVVEGVRYSQADVRRAQGLLEEWLRRSGQRGHWSTAYACHDGEGLVVGMVPSFLETADVPALQEELAEAVGMPVMLVDAERLRPQPGRLPDDRHGG